MPKRRPTDPSTKGKNKSSTPSTVPKRSRTITEEKAIALIFESDNEEEFDCNYPESDLEDVTDDENTNYSYTYHQPAVSNSDSLSGGSSNRSNNNNVSTTAGSSTSDSSSSNRPRPNTNVITEDFTTGSKT